MKTIREIQKRLIAIGFDVGPSGADNDFGPRTRQAVAEFQKARGLYIKWPGTIGPKTLAALFDELTATPLVWIEEAKRFLGMHEVSDAKTLDKALRLDASAIPWCGGFVAMVISKALPNEPIPTNPLWARNWLKFGEQITGVRYGAIATFERGSGGHVGFVVGHDRTYLHILGGNQSNRVSIAKIAKSRLLGYTWPVTAGIEPGPELPHTTIAATVTTNEA